MTYWHRAFATGGTLFLALLTLSSYAGAQTLKTLYSFTGGADGGNPNGSPVIGSGGLLYGTTCEGGTSNYGTVFSLTPPSSPGGSWTEAVLYSFMGSPNDGSCPSGSLVIGSGGALYGATMSGGQCSGATTCGTVFSLTPSSSPGGAWTETIIYNFMGGSDGAYPNGSLAIGSGGVLYGTTGQGGSGVVPGCPAGCGTVFSLAPPVSPGGAWTGTVLHTFDSPRSGAYPTTGVVIGKGGVLFGATDEGGTSGRGGTVFAVLPPASPGGAWAERILYGFKGPPTDGEGAVSLVIGRGGVLYGTTQFGGIGCGGAAQCSR